MTAISNVGDFIVALQPSDIWFTDDQAATFLSYSLVHFKSHVICLGGFPAPIYIMANSKGRRWNLESISKWLRERPETTKKLQEDPAKFSGVIFIKSVDKKYITPILRQTLRKYLILL